MTSQEHKMSRSDNTQRERHALEAFKAAYPDWNTP